MAVLTINERYERLRNRAERERSAAMPRPVRPVEIGPRIAFPSLAGVSRFPAGCRVQYNADAHSHWKAHRMIGTALGFGFKPEYRDKNIHLEADWLVRVDWDDGLGEHPVHPEWLEIVHKSPSY